MPAQILHVLFGEDALRAAAASLMGKPYGSIIASYVESVLGAQGVFFRLGCQGPDLFYHNQRTRPVSLEYGTLLHRRSYGDFSADLLKRTMRDRSPISGADSRSAYALGFASHAFLDRAAHPYIVCKSGWVSPSRPETARFARCHAFFERILDVLMLERLRGIAADAWDQESLLGSCSEVSRDPSVEAIAASLSAVFPERAGTDELLRRRVRNAFSDAIAFYRVTNPARTSLNKRLPDGFEYLRSASGRASVALVYPERFSYRIDYLNLSRSDWAHPCAGHRGDQRSFPDLYSEAAAAAVAFFTGLLGHFAETGLIDAAEVSRVVGNGGLSVVDDDGNPCAPTHAEPLPLDAVLDHQYRLRLKWIADRLDGRPVVD